MPVKTHKTTNPFLTNQSLSGLINKLVTNEQQKETLLAELPEMDRETRLKLLHTLKAVFLLDVEEKESLQRLATL